MSINSIAVFPESAFYNHLVAPYWVNFNIHQSGHVSYEIHNTTTDLMSLVNNFVQQQEDEDFVGTWMMVATYSDVPLQYALNKVNL